MDRKNYFDPSKKTDGEQLINEQLMQSYHSGVIDNDVPLHKEKDETTE